jgi:hypothetical protein
MRDLRTWHVYVLRSRKDGGLYKGVARPVPLASPEVRPLPAEGFMLKMPEELRGRQRSRSTSPHPTTRARER